GPVLGHERIFDDHLFAAGSAQTPGMPVIADAKVGPWNEKGPVVRRPCSVAGRNDSTQKNPVGVIDPTGKAPASAKLESAVDPLDLATAHITRGDQNAAVLAPHVFLRARIEQPQLPVVDRHHPVDPAAGHAPLGEGYLQVEENLRIEFVTPVPFGLYYPKEPGAFELRDGLCRSRALCLGRSRALGQNRHHLARARQESVHQFTLVTLRLGLHLACRCFSHASLLVSLPLNRGDDRIARRANSSSEKTSD